MPTKCPKCDSDNTADSKFCKECGTQLLPSKDVPEVTRTLETPREELTRGTTFANRYEIIEELGRGGMGRVYRVDDTKVKEEVALKLIKSDVAADKKTIERFRNELKSARKIRHKNVCQMFDLGEYEGIHFITMEYVTGEDLKSLIRRVRKIPIDTAISITKQVCEGLTEAHKIGIVHRDLKPSNIMIDKAGNARIMDFGIARSVKGEALTGADVMIGTPDYMSPEQVEGKEIDQRSDIYSLGVVLFEMLTGEKPFKGDTSLSVAMKHKSEAPPNPKWLNDQIPDRLSRLVLMCLEKEKEKRYQTAEELLSALKDLDGKKIHIADREGKKASIAVLPFTNMSADPEQEYFCDGMTEEIISDLSKVRALHVISRSSAMTFKGTRKRVREIAADLGVQYVLEGSVRKAGNNLRITAQLIDAQTDRHLWAEKYTGTLGDVFGIQEEVSHSIIKSIQLELSLQEKEGLSKQVIKKPEAYEAYLKGRYSWNKRTPEGMRTALELFKEAVDIDPGYAGAYSGMADVYNLLGMLLFMPSDEAYPLAKGAARRALAIDDTVAEAHTSLALVSFVYDWNWGVAEREFLRAIELSPSSASAHHFYGAFFASAMGRHEEAIAEMRRAYELDPLAPVHSADMAFVLLFARRYGEAIQQSLKTLEYFPEFHVTYHYLVHAYVLERRYEEAIGTSRKATALTRDHPKYLSIMGYALAAAGRKDEAYSILERLIGDKADFPVPAYEIALIHTALGEYDTAFEWLERAQKEHAWEVCWLRVDPCVDPLRAQMRFQQLVKRMNFPE
jgi:serine/threonine protein kinase/Tfp pilus assembly protein PilF